MREDGSKGEIKAQAPQPNTPPWPARPSPYAPCKKLSEAGQFLQTTPSEEMGEDHEITGDLKGKFTIEWRKLASDRGRNKKR